MSTIWLSQIITNVAIIQFCRHYKKPYYVIANIIRALQTPLNVGINRKKSADIGKSRHVILKFDKHRHNLQS